ncbi:GMC family oxidoreductase N-terminal domain-containing protein [Streptomyces cadmiisoli]|uniref:GMC family oxidoreductase N-terminal domain-containing protein n=1 Tax=Streptomyces cadmiisoli TaxID=2184053 RepID=UPI003D71E485
MGRHPATPPTARVALEIGVNSRVPGERYSAARGYLHPAMARANLTVRTQALVRRVLFEGTRATGVEYTDAAGAAESVHAEVVVLSAGALRTPQLLMLSGIGPADHLADHDIHVLQDLPGGQSCASLDLWSAHVLTESRLACGDALTGTASACQQDWASTRRSSSHRTAFGAPDVLAGRSAPAPLSAAVKYRSAKQADMTW